MQYRTIPVLRMRWGDARDRLMRKGGHQNLTRQTRYDMGKKGDAGKTQQNYIRTISIQIITVESYCTLRRRSM